MSAEKESEVMLFDSIEAMKAYEDRELATFDKERHEAAAFAKTAYDELRKAAATGLRARASQKER